ncbi:MAG: DUF6612 family protein [Acetivibrionales bacterium]|jgi:hypothetical protein
MKKTGLVFILSLVAAFCIISFVQAEDSIVETPDVKIIIDGRLTSYENVPLSINQRTFLPLREFLVNLGVQDDNEHIRWNSSEKSVTVYKDDIRIYLKLGSKIVYINNKPIEMDAAPISYTNQKVYIPIRFVSEALNKKIVWDGSSNTVLIRDIDDFEEVKGIVEKSNLAFDSISKYRLNMDTALRMGNEELSMNIKARTSAEVDNEKKKMHMIVNTGFLGMDLSSDIYYCDGVQYVEDPVSGEWEKTEMPKQTYDDMFRRNSSIDMLDATDALCAALVISESAGPDEIILKGNIYMDEIFQKVSKYMNRDNGNGIIKPEYSFDEYYVEMSIDRDTYLLNSMLMNVKSGVKSGGEDIPMDININIIYGDYNGDFDVVIPQEIFDSAVNSKGTINEFDFILRRN